mgnify:CR=1 FL=1
MNDRPKGKYWDELETGASYSTAARTVTEADIVAFAGVSGDFNPVHINEEFASQTMFKGRIAHGMLSAAFVSTVFGTKLPELSSSRSWAIHTAAIEKFPDRFALLERTSKQVFDNPKYKEAYAKTGAPVETIQYGDRALCTRYAMAMIDLANEYRSLLSAKGKKS